MGAEAYLIKINSDYHFTRDIDNSEKMSLLEIINLQKEFYQQTEIIYIKPKTMNENQSVNLENNLESVENIEEITQSFRKETAILYALFT